jgi:cytochrome c oxidase subunit 3
MPLLSDRAGKTAQVVVLPSSLEDPNKPPPGLLKLGVWIGCGAITTFFAALEIAYFWRRATPGFWDPQPLPKTLWLSTAIILASSAVFEAARRVYRRGRHDIAARLLWITACLGCAFLVSQLASWRALVAQGVYLENNPYSSFFYLFTGLHAAHLLGGLIALGFVLLRRTRREVIDATAHYWHFLGALWIVLFATLST